MDDKEFQSVIIYICELYDISLKVYQTKTYKIEL